MKIEAVCTMVVFGIAPRYPEPGITSSLMDKNGRTYELVFFGETMRSFLDALHVRKLHQARGKKVFVELDKNEKLVGISGYYYPAGIVPCSLEFSSWQ